jgi:hypothetical protein
MYFVLNNYNEITKGAILFSEEELLPITVLPVAKL